MRVKLRVPISADGRDFRHSLTMRQEYEVIGIEADDFRLVNDNQEPVLYDACCFEMTDSTEPNYWKSFYGEEGERYACPKDWGAPGYFEAWHDGNAAIKSQFWTSLKSYYPWTARILELG